MTTIHHSRIRFVTDQTLPSAMGNLLAKQFDDSLRQHPLYLQLEKLVQIAVDYNLRVYVDKEYKYPSPLIDVLKADYLLKGYQIDIVSNSRETRIYQKKIGESLPPYDCNCDSYVEIKTSLL